MESEILRQLKKDYPTAEAQQARLIEMVSTFGSLSDSEMKFTVGDILCLAKLLYEAGDEEIIYDIRDQLTTLERRHRSDKTYVNNLEYLNKCLTNFKPAMFKSIQLYFSGIYGVDLDLITCLPKVMGQQVGAKVEIKRSLEDRNPVLFYAKAHQEFCSKSHPQFIAITSDGTGTVDFKELFIYRFLQLIGYGPKVHFVIDRDVAQSRIDEGILIATQDLGYSKRPAERDKTFKTFREVKEELSVTPIDSIANKTRQDIIVIDMLSRAFLLEDVMINQGNFGITTAAGFFEPFSSSIKWRIIDFIPPRLVEARGDDYSYGRHYPGGISIFYSFKVGNISHTYDDDELRVINHILTEEHAREFWLPAIERLSNGDRHHLSVAIAAERAFKDIVSFMEENIKALQIKPDRLARRIADLDRYRIHAIQNFAELERGIREYASMQSNSTLSPE